MYIYMDIYIYCIIFRVAWDTTNNMMDCGMITQYPFPFLQDVIRYNKMGYTYKIKIISNTYKQQ